MRIRCKSLKENCFSLLSLVVLYILFILFSQLSAITSFFSDHVFFAVVNLSFFQGIIGSSPCIAFWEGLTLCLLKAETNYHPVWKVVV